MPGELQQLAAMPTTIKIAMMTGQQNAVALRVSLAHTQFAKTEPGQRRVVERGKPAKTERVNESGRYWDTSASVSRRDHFSEYERQ